jgi:hypothetical protein
MPETDRILSRHPSSPGRLFLCWQRKIKIQLEELLAVENPDTRTLGEISRLQQRLKCPIDRKRSLK